MWDVHWRPWYCQAVWHRQEHVGRPWYDKEGEDAIPLSNVNGANLSKVIEWKTFHKDDPSLPEDEDNKKKTDTISSWDLDFLKVDQETLFKVIPAANYLNIKKLLDLTCKTLANILKGRILRRFVTSSTSETVWLQKRRSRSRRRMSGLWSVWSINIVQILLMVFPYNNIKRFATIRIKI